MKHIKVVRRILYILAALSTAFYFRYSVLSLALDTEVSGRKYTGLFVGGGETNGFEYLVFDYPYFQFTKDNAINWKECSRLSKSLEGYLGSFVKDWKTNTSYKFVSEIEPNGYKAYIQLNDRVIFVRGFPDLGGVPPNEQEKRICMDQGVAH